jgi:hypothetical protein
MPTAPPPRRGRIVIGTVLVHRHGARAISNSAVVNLRAACPRSSSGAAHATDEWGEDEREYITSVGEEQMRLLGRWFCSGYLAREVPEVGRRVRAAVDGGAAAAASAAAAAAGAASSSHEPTPAIKWRSSPVQRVRDSGALFWDAFDAAYASSTSPASPSPLSPFLHAPTPVPYPEGDSHAERVLFLCYRSGEPAGLVAEFRKSRHLERAALRVRAPLERLYEKVAGGPPMAPPGPLPEDADYTLANAAAASSGTAVHAALDAATAGPDLDPSHDPEDAALAEQLWCINYLYELLCSELSWPGTAQAIANDVVVVAAGAGEEGKGKREGGGGTAAPAPLPQGPTGASVAVVPNVKNTLVARLSPSDEAFLVHAARWLWDQRYFSYPGARAMAGKVGGALLGEIVGDLAAMAEATTRAGLAARKAWAAEEEGATAGAAGSPPLLPAASVYSAHDHTLFALLAALRAPKAPERVLGYGAYLLFELVAEVDPDDPTSHTPIYSVTVRVNDDPFPRAREGRPLDFEPGRARVLFDGAALDGLQALVERYVKEGAAAAGSRASAAPGDGVYGSLAREGPPASGGAGGGGVGGAGDEDEGEEGEGEEAVEAVQ